LITDRMIRRGTFHGVGELDRAIYDWLLRWNHTPSPFVWKATADVMLDKVRQCKQPTGTAHQDRPPQVRRSHVQEEPVLPVHPGEILREDLMAPLGLSLNALVRDLRVPVTRVSQIARGRRSITADTALRLARAFGSTPEFRLNLQSAYDPDVAAKASIEEIQRYVHPGEAA